LQTGPCKELCGWILAKHSKSHIRQNQTKTTSGLLHYHMGNWKQWKRKPEMENGNGKWKQLKLDANEC